MSIKENILESWIMVEHLSEGNIKLRDRANGICKAHALALFKVGYKNIGTLAVLVEDPYWYEKVPGIGFETSKKLTAVMCREGFIDRSSETCNRVFTKNYL